MTPEETAVVEIMRKSEAHKAIISEMAKNIDDGKTEINDFILAFLRYERAQHPALSASDIASAVETAKEVYKFNPLRPDNQSAQEYQE